MTKNIENAQKEINNSEYFTPRSRIDSKLDEHEDEDEDEDEDENEETGRDLYQGSIEGMKVLKLPDEIESKDEKSQIYLKNNLNKIRNNFLNIYDKYQRFFKHISGEEKNSIDYKILSSNAKGINFYDRYDALYNYLDYLLKILKKDKLFLKDLSKVFKLKKVYAASKGDINNTEKAYHHLVLNINKTIDDVFYKNAKNEVSEKDKNIFQEAKKLFNLRVKIYKKLFFKRENLRPEETITEGVKLKRKHRAEEEKEVNNIRDENNFIDYKKSARLINFRSNSINNGLVRKYFSVRNLGGMLEQLRGLKNNP